MKTFILFRSPAGFGKSTMALALRRYWQSEGYTVNGPYEADDWMVENGKYKFDAKKLNYCHKQCLKSCEDAMFAGADVVIQSNTNIRRQHYQPYLDLAKKFGYKVQEIIIRGDGFQNEHGVPPEKVEQMKASLEL